MVHGECKFALLKIKQGNCFQRSANDWTCLYQSLFFCINLQPTFYEYNLTKLYMGLMICYILVELGCGLYRYTWYAENTFVSMAYFGIHSFLSVIEDSVTIGKGGFVARLEIKERDQKTF